MAEVLITGASTGIGEATALHLDRLGHRVFAGVRKASDGERLAGASRSGRLQPVTLDVTDPAQIEGAIAEVSEATDGRLDGVVNNAGVAVGGPLEFLPLDDFRMQMDINVTGLLAVTQAALPLVRRSARGRVVFVGSISGRLAVPMTGAYSASKFAVEALSDAFRMELAPFGIGVSLIQPGAIKTPIWDKGRAQADEMSQKYDAEALELYRDGVQSVVEGIEQQDRAGIDPIEVAKAIEKALFAERPAARYKVGTDAKAGAVLARVLPDRAKDLVITKFIRP
ncbi:MAG: SDR family oxidoreductase [Actinomycetota bacterium]